VQFLAKESLVTVYKLNLAREVVFSWSGRVLRRVAGEIVLEAAFARGPLELGYVTLRPGDRFVEHFYSDRWYNVYAIYAVEDGAFKGWYCNITRPAEVAERDGRLEIRSVDLALDYFVAPDGRALVLDEAEFAELRLAPAEVEAARAALGELQRLAADRAGPFAARL
jgi:predicted RNA-binding protein associated with RNAse of E/G family